MMLTDKQKTMLIDAVEEEIMEFDNWKFLGDSQVAVFQREDYQVQIYLTRNEDEFIGLDEEE